jgi:hypothetical protein
MSAISFLSPTWNARFLFAPSNMNLPALALISKMVFSRKDMLIKMSVRNKNG